MAKVILGAGNPLLDISAQMPDDSIFEKYGLQGGNAILADESHAPLYVELASRDNVEYIAGGATQNSIRAAQWMLPEENKTHFIGSVGDDTNGGLLANAAIGGGVQPHYMISETRTGCCAVVVVDKERSLVADLAAANDYNISHFNTPEIQEVVNSADIFYSSCFFLTVSPDTLVEIGKHSLANEKTLMINIAAPFLVQFFWDQMQSVLPFADFVFCNETEAAAFADKMEWDSSDLKEVAKKLAALPKEGGKPRTVIFTRGSDSTIVANAEGCTEYPVPKIESNLIVDTNGAGDSFVGGFLAGYAQGKPIEKCVDAGCYCAGLVIQQSGCTFPTPEPSFEW
eukprot:TRINITY_DN9673_c0_g1_i1.p1 TRINITY_DN9673_c0_g1~~TRINITY_DN9673_c0_g1_i1.p1  ORF type:complete len:360 (-),score=114.15 TRINITY_DN9673_c0_g1_i1:35-1057(-)